MADDVTLPGSGSVVETQQQPDASHRQVVAVADLPIALVQAIKALSVLGSALDPASGRLRVLIDALGGAQTLGTVSTVSTVSTVGTLSNQTALGGRDTSSLQFESMFGAWANNIRGRIS